MATQRSELYFTLIFPNGRQSATSRHDCQREALSTNVHVQENAESVEEVSRRLRRNRFSSWDLLVDELDERVGIGRCRKVIRTAWLHLQAKR